MERIVALLLKYKYLVMFWLMFAEGPIVSFICAFMAAQGFFSFGIVYLLSICGDLVGDLIRYRVGRFARRFGAKKFLKMQENGEVIDMKSLKWQARISVWVASKIQKLEQKSVFQYLNATMKKHFFWALFLVKITPPLSVPGQISFGFFKIPFPKFFIQTTLLIIIFESVFLNLGYFSSLSIDAFKGDLDTFSLIISIVVVGGLALWGSFSIIKRIKSFSKIRE